jgi:hypothetical protein
LWIGMALGFAVMRGRWRIVQAGALAWLVVWSSISIAQIYFDPVLQKSDIRALAHYIETHEVEDDVIVLHDAIIQLTFEYYYHGDATVRAIPAYNSYSDTARALRDFDLTALRSARVWFVWGPEPVGFPARLLRDRADETMTRVSRERFASHYQQVVVDLYEPQSPLVDPIPERAHYLFSASVEGLALLAVEMPEHVATGDRFVKITTYWQVNGPVSQTYFLVTELVDAAGHVRGRVREPLWRYYSPDNWPQRTPVRWESYVPLAFGSPPGVYQVRMTVFDFASGEPLHVLDAQTSDAVGVGEAQIARGGVAERAPDLTRRLDMVVNDDVRLIGYELASEVLRPGAIFELDLLWQVEQTPSQMDVLQVELLAPGGAQVFSTNVALDEVFPAREWQVGDYIRTPAFLRVPIEGNAGMHTMQLVTPSGVVALGEVRVEEYPLDTRVPDVAHALDANFGDMIALRGYDIEGVLRPGESISVDLIWQTLRKPDRNYTVFLHVFGGADQPVTQGDGDPLGGLRPTRSWRPTEVLRDTHTIDLPGDLAPGVYRMIVGWYDRESPDRLALVPGGETQFELGTLRVER